jgi:hypothetical protein
MMLVVADQVRVKAAQVGLLPVPLLLPPMKSSLVAPGWLRGHCPAMLSR